MEQKHLRECHDLTWTERGGLCLDYPLSLYLDYLTTLGKGFPKFTTDKKWQRNNLRTCSQQMEADPSRCQRQCFLLSKQCSPVKNQETMKAFSSSKTSRFAQVHFLKVHCLECKPFDFCGWARERGRWSASVFLEKTSKRIVWMLTHLGGSSVLGC